MTTKGKESEKRDVMFSNQLVTTADLKNFKTDILEAIRKMIESDQGLPAKNDLNSLRLEKLNDRQETIQNK